MRPAFVIAFNDLRLLLRERMAAFFTFALPLGVAFFFGFIFGGGSDTPTAMPVATWNGSGGGASAAFVQALEKDGTFELTIVPTRQAGEQLVRTGKAVGLIALPADFDERARSMLTGNGPVVELVMDPSRRAEGGLITGKLAQISFQTMFRQMASPEQMEEMITQLEHAVMMAGLPVDDQRIFRDALQRVPALMHADDASQEPGADGDAAQEAMDGWMPVRVEPHALQMGGRVAPVNPFAISFLQGIAWGLFGAVLSFTGSMVEERERGTMLRLLAAPIRPLQVLSGKALACFVTCVAVQVMLVTVGALLCGVRVSSVPLFALATLMTAFAFTGIMMALAACFRTQGGAQGAGRAALLVLAMIGGGTVPLFVLPPILQMASSISPFKWAITAAEGATWRAWSLTEMLPALAVLAVIGAVGATVAAAAMRRRPA